jgi:hypothetical protein
MAGMSCRSDRGTAPRPSATLLRLVVAACLLAAVSPAQAQPESVVFSFPYRGMMGEPVIAAIADARPGPWLRFPGPRLEVAHGQATLRPSDHARSPRLQLISNHTGRRSFWRGQKIRDRDYWAWRDRSGPNPYEIDVCAPAGRGADFGACSVARAEGALWALLRCNEFEFQQVLIAHRAVVPGFRLPGPAGGCSLPQTVPLGHLPDVPPAISFATDRAWAMAATYFPNRSGPDECFGILYELLVDPELVFPAGGPWPRDPSAIREVIATYLVFPLNVPGAEAEHVVLFELRRRGAGYTRERRLAPGFPEPSAGMERDCPPPAMLPVRVEVE